MLEIQQQQNELQFCGELNRETVVAQWPFKLLGKEQSAVIFDFSRLVHVDTAGLAWLLQVMATAKANGQQLTLRQLPDQLRKLADVSGVLHLLTIDC